MVETAQLIELKLSEKLSDSEFRKKFFLAETSARIAAQIISLRKKRGLNQTELAERIGTRQPAISRVERADYHNWSFNTLRSIAEQLDARIRVIIEPSEDILFQYDTSNPITDADMSPTTSSRTDTKCLDKIRGVASSKRVLLAFT